MTEADTIMTAVGELTIARARPEDADTVLAILLDASRWLVARGIDQWRPEHFTPEELLTDIARGEMYLATRDSAPVGTLKLQWEDRPTWGDMPDDAGYVHRLAVRRVFAGRALGQRLLEWAARRAAASGKTYLRLDCIAANRALRAYYERAGFTLRREVCGSALFEKRV
jgi:ribosomal protein S18 acetylase RimI-like enzyme